MIKDTIRWYITGQLGYNPKMTWRFFCGIPRYLLDLKKFKSQYKGAITIRPALNDRSQEGGVTSSEYFWQDLLVARMINEANPRKHIDIGSRIDGFVANIASFREIEVFDVRSITRRIPNVTFIQADLMCPQVDKVNYCDSISCLHAIEHFGLGRYGDNINVEGYKLGLENMGALLENNGTFYLSTPIGKNRVEFNANRVFDPRIILEEGIKNSLVLQKLITITGDAIINEFILQNIPFSDLARQEYSLGIFIFRKIKGQ